jgi:apolipoprotein N-acyltransferase
MLSRALAFLFAHPRWTALFAGGLSATGFSPLGLWPLTILMLALMLALVARAARKRSAFGIGWLFGVGHFAVGLNWIATAFTFQAAMPAWLGWVAVVGLALYLAVYPGLAAMCAWWGSTAIAKKARHPGEGRGPSPSPSKPSQRVIDPGLRRDDGEQRSGQGASHSLPFILLFAAAWIVTEWLRSWVFTGFAWNPLSAAIVETLFTGYAPELGTYGLSGVVICIAGFALTLSRAALSPAGRADFKKSGSLVVLGFIAIFGLLLAALFLMPSLVTPANRGNSGTAITIIQPNIEQGDKWDLAQRAENFRKLARLTLAERTADSSPRLILWPEAAVPDYLEGGYPLDWYLEPPSFTRQRLAALLGPDDLLLTGAVRLEPNRDRTDILGARNSLFVVNARGELGPRYDKAHLVPGGEYLPLRTILAPLGLSRLAPGAVDFWPGPGARTLDLSGQGFGRVGVQICYEIIFSGQVVDRANRPDFIFNPSNDAWFGSWGPPQHLAQARLRAIEEGLPVVRSTPTGISAIIAPDGRVLRSIPLGEAGRIDDRLPLPHEPTLFARYGNILPLLFAALLALAAIAMGRRRR